MQQPLTLEEIELLERQADLKEQLLITLLYESGCTVSELVNIRVRDVQIDRQLLIINGRKVAITNYVIALLRKFLKKERSEKRGGRSRASRFSPNQPLLKSRESSRMSARRVEQILARLGERALGKRVTPQQLRATRIIHDFLNHKPISEIERRVGVKSIQRYLYFYYKHGFSHNHRRDQRSKGWVS